MEEFYEYERSYWSYYLILENRFTMTLRYITLDCKNFCTFSYELFDQLMLICAEIETFLKSITGINKEDTVQDGKKYVTNIKILVQNAIQKLPELKKITVNVVTQNKIYFTPFKNLKIDDNSPLFMWWQDHNFVKHNRAEMEECGNFENVLHALSTLFAIHIVKMRDISKKMLPRQESVLFGYTIDGETTTISSHLAVLTEIVTE